MRGSTFGRLYLISPWCRKNYGETLPVCSVVVWFAFMTPGVPGVIGHGVKQLNSAVPAWCLTLYQVD